MKKFNILHLYDYMKLGGAETHIITLSKAMMDLGHNVYIAGPNGPALEWVKRENINFIESPLDDWEKQIESLQDILMAIDKYRIDIVHAHPFNSQIVGALAAYIRKKPCITTIHGEYVSPALEAFLRPLFAKYICVGKNLKELYMEHGIDDEDIEVIKNGVPIKKRPDRTSFFRNGLINLCYISRLDDDKIKALEFLLDCIPQLVKEFPLRLIIVGDGSNFNRVREICKSINEELHEEIIQLVGGSTDVFRYIEKSDMVVGIGRVLLEAVSMGKFPLCIGDSYYTGFVGADDFIKFSDYNFTGRNMKREQKLQNLMDDIREIYFDIDNKFKDLVGIWNILKDSFSLEISAKKHIDCYKRAVDEFSHKAVEFDPSALGEYPLSKELKAFLSNKDNY